MPSIRKRGGIVSAVTRVENYLNDFNHEELSIGGNKILKDQLKLVKTMKEKYAEVHQEIISQIHDGERVLVENTQQQAFNVRCDQLITTLEGLLDNIPEDSEAEDDSEEEEDSEEASVDAKDFVTVMREMMKQADKRHSKEMKQHRLQMEQLISSFSSNSSASVTKLPHISLPKFDGRFSEWISFKHRFQSSVTRHPNISAVQKLDYLMSALSGDAEALVKNLPLTGPNFEVAWELLTSKFERKNEIVGDHVRAFYNLSRITSFNSQSINRLYNTVSGSVMAVDAMKISQRDPWLIHYVVDRLDSESKMLWGRECGDDIPTMKKFLDFLQQRCKDASNISNSAPNAKPSTSTKPQPAKRQIATLQSSGSNTCKCCQDGSHPMYQCEKFLAQTPQERFDTVKRLSLCRNCFASHMTHTCTFHKCRKCQRRHNILLHDRFENSAPSDPPPKDAPASDSSKDNPPTPSKSKDSPANICASSLSSSSGSPSTPPRVYLATAMVDIFTRNREKISCRILLDGGAQVCVMTTNLYQRLKLHKSPSDVSILGVGHLPSQVKYKVSATITSRLTDDTFTFPCYVLPKIAGDIPNWPTDIREIQIPPNIQLADPAWAQSQPVDLLVGGDPYWSSFLNHSISLGHGKPHLRETVFGYVVVGEHHSQSSQVSNIFHVSAESSLDDALKRFWEVENIPEEMSPTDEHKMAEDHFVRTHKRTPDGRFQVQLPFKQSPDNLGSSRTQAVRQFLSTERQFEKKPEMKALYTEVIQDYLRRNWIEPVPKDELNLPAYYMPHHGILKDSLTTKLRVVYNASAATSSGHSLNDLLLVGPPVQPELIYILLNFRKHQFAMTADISKMYLQLVLEPSHANFQRLVWRDSKNQPIQDFRITRVCFGVACSPFLATRALIELSNLHEDTHPLAATALRKSFYVDDGIISSPSLAEAQKTQRELIEILQSAGFVLTKWSSNHPVLVPDTAASSPSDAVAVNQTFVSALGLDWDCITDTFRFSSPVELSEKPLTKREVASSVAKLFDPLGLVGPIVMVAKLILQDAHKLKSKWDAPLSEDIVAKWNKFVLTLREINSLEIPRWISSIPYPVRLEFHAFCDASLRAYGTSIYVVTYDDFGNISSRLLISKSRVAPIDQSLTIPRLELCGAQLAVETTTKIKDTYNPASIHYWTDSMVVLYWLNNPPGQSKVFVSNRVKKILKESTMEQWRHVPTTQNPADLISRGTTPQTLAISNLWWNGPDWLVASHSSWPPPFETTLCDPGEVECLTTVAEETLLETFLSKGSSLGKIQRITAYCLRFGKNLQSSISNTPKKTGPLTAVELEGSLSSLIRLDQGEHFDGFVSHLQNGTCVSSKWKFLLSLTPFLDEENLLRVGGRIEKSQESFATKHPILLPKSKLTKMIIAREHVRQLHAAPTLLLASLRQRYWPIAGRRMTKKVYHECHTCVRAKPQPLKQLMGNLPESRVTLIKPFHSTGIDFAGPIPMLSAATRGVRSRKMGTQKVYIAIFVCMATKAAHLELVTSLSSEAFIASLRRFAARRSTPRHIFTDCGKNFEGAANELSKLLAQETSQTELVTSTSEDGILWHFNPPAAPHHGGLWEACVKSTKFHLTRLTNSTVFSYEELATILCQVENVLNSRPICALTDNPNESTFLTPGHFLVGSAGNSPPDPDVTQIPANRQSYWQACQARLQEFAKKWKLQYLNTLQQRPKWRISEKNLIPDEVVLFLDESNREGAKWVLGRIEAVHPGTDGRVRVVTVRTAKGSYRRPITKIARLPRKDDYSAPGEQPGEDVYVASATVQRIQKTLSPPPFKIYDGSEREKP